MYDAGNRHRRSLRRGRQTGESDHNDPLWSMVERKKRERRRASQRRSGEAGEVSEQPRKDQSWKGARWNERVRGGQDSRRRGRELSMTGNDGGPSLVHRFIQGIARACACACVCVCVRRSVCLLRRRVGREWIANVERGGSFVEKLVSKGQADEEGRLGGQPFKRALQLL